MVEWATPEERADAERQRIHAELAMIDLRVLRPLRELMLDAAGVKQLDAAARAAARNALRIADDEAATLRAAAAAARIEA